MLRQGDLTSLVKEFGLQGSEPFFFREDGGRQFREVLVGVQRGDHPLWEKLQGLIPGHLLPEESFRQVRGEGGNGLSVISMFFAWDLVTINEAGNAEDIPPASWYVAKANFTAMVPHLYASLRDRFLPAGVGIVHPKADGLYERPMGRFGFRTSNWSERHVAYACGLGCFGLHGGLITAAGSAGRLVSFIAGEEFDAYADFPDDPFCYCLLLTEGKCGACIERCPVGAISGWGCDVARCRSYVHGVHEAIPESRRHGAGQACNFCMTGVPCATARPGQDGL